MGSSAEPHGIVFFDVDGTLVPHGSSSSFLADRLGHRAEVDRAETDYAAGRLDNDQVCTIDAAGWAGRTTREIEEWLTELPLVAGIAETLAWCHSAAVVPYLASLAWSPVSAYLVERFGFAGACGPTLETIGGVFTGRVTQVFDEFDKRDFALGICRASGVEPGNSLAVGDGRSDLPLFDAIGYSIALNASEDARACATARIDSVDLTATIPLLASWFRGGAEPVPRPATALVAAP